LLTHVSNDAAHKIKTAQTAQTQAGHGLDFCSCPVRCR
jgi:hypothetical protein